MLHSCARADSSAGRALRSQCRGREFDPPSVHHKTAANSVPSKSDDSRPGIDVIANVQVVESVGLTVTDTSAMGGPSSHVLKPGLTQLLVEDKFKIVAL